MRKLNVVVILLLEDVTLLLYTLLILKILQFFLIKNNSTKSAGPVKRSQIFETIGTLGLTNINL